VRGRKPLAYLPIYKALHEKQIKFVVVGGQACNIWSVLYGSSEPELKQYEPFTSKDLDVYSRSQNDVVVLAEAVQEQPVLNNGASPDPAFGLVIYKSSSKNPMPISFISGAYGIKDASKIFESRQTLGLGRSKTPVHVMHPFFTMQCKAALVVHPPRESANDLRHLKMSVHYTRRFILELAKMGRDRDALKVCKSIVLLALSKLGREVYKKFQIRLEAALPSKSQIGSKAPKLESYMQNSLPERLEKIKSFRR
jgi:hypothetical protein